MRARAPAKTMAMMMPAVSISFLTRQMVSLLLSSMVQMTSSRQVLVVVVMEEQDPVSSLPLEVLTSQAVVSLTLAVKQSLPDEVSGVSRLKWVG